MSHCSIARQHQEAGHSLLTNACATTGLNLATVRLIKEHHGLSISLADISTADVRALAVINGGDMDDVLRSNAGVVKDAVCRAGVKSIEDLAILIALCRPGQSHLLEQYIQRKAGRAPIVYEDPALEPILRETCGLILFDEQFDRIVFELAGDPTGAFGYSSPEEAGEMRNAIKGKTAPEVTGQIERFADGCIMKGILTRSEAMLYFETLLESVGHCACKAGSIAAALLVYQCAYLKARFPEEYEAVRAAAMGVAPDAGAQGKDHCGKTKLASPFTGESMTEINRDAKLLANIQAQLPELIALLAETTSHWTYEDQVYRFYHHSFKVYHLQSVTQRIVEALRRIAPAGTTFCAEFEEIIQHGASGKDWKIEHNKQWTAHTRPFVEAFFHAKFFLEMAVKYGTELDEVPQQLPSGWAALLCPCPAPSSHSASCCIWDSSRSHGSPGE